jgi:hypothetical protein
MLNSAADDHALIVNRNVAAPDEPMIGFQPHPVPRNIGDCCFVIARLHAVHVPEKGIFFDEITWFCASIIHGLIVAALSPSRHSVTFQDSETIIPISVTKRC